MIVIDNNRILKDDTGLSLKSSKLINVYSKDCGHSYKSRKRDLFNVNYECKICRQERVIGDKVSLNSTLDKEIINNVKTMLHGNNPKRLSNRSTLIELKCPDCNTVYRKTLGVVYDDLINEINPCRTCFPVHRVKSGVLFMANYPELSKMLEMPLESDVFCATKEKLKFRLPCSHTVTKRPLDLIRYGIDNCNECVPLKNKNQKNVNIAYKNQKNVIVKCEFCKNDYSIKKYNYNRNIKKNGKYKCVNCFRKNPPFAPIFDTWDKITWSDKNNKQPEDLTTGSAYRAILECNKGHEWDAFVYALLNSPTPGNCPRCYTPGSAGERELQEFVRSLGFNIVCNDRSVIKPLELDVFIPEKNIAIEYNGDYWHSVSAGTDRSAHFNKWKQCDGKNVRLLTVWDSDWHSNKDCVKSFIRGELGVDSESVFSGDFSVSIVGDLAIVEEFFNTYCIHGFKSADLYIGAFDKNGELVAVSSWLIKDNGDIILSNFVSSFSFLVSCLREMLSHVCSLFPQPSRVFTVLDNVTHNSKIYEELGFIKIKDLEPDYFYYWNGSHYSKNYFTLNRFQEHDELLYASDLSIQELMETNSIHKIYDYGKTLWEMK